MLRLVHPAPPTQPPPPKGRRSATLKLTPEERRHAQAALRNIKKTFGSWPALAAALKVAECSLLHALHMSRGSAILYLRVAQLAGISFEEMLKGRLTVAGRCPSCGSHPPAT